MIKTYSNQSIELAQDVYTTDQDWWMVFDPDSKKVIVKPQQCSGYTSSPLTMIVAESKEELNQYIVDNNLIISKDFQIPV